MSSVDIDVKEDRLSGLSGELRSVYTKLSLVKEKLESLHTGIRANWSDEAVEEFTEKFNEGMERIWDLLVAVDNIEVFFSDAATGYVAADREVESL